jgi:hypothetical protein
LQSGGSTQQQLDVKIWDWDFLRYRKTVMEDEFVFPRYYPGKGRRVPEENGQERL